MSEHPQPEPTDPMGEHHAEGVRCANCGTPLQGPWCHHCGQEVHDPFKRFRGAVGETLENVFHFDARLSRTLIPLFLRPGFLTREYTAGRRVRYVAPLRLMFFLAILAFLAIQLSVEITPPQVHVGAQQAFAQAPNAASVERLRLRLDGPLARSLAQPDSPAWSRAFLLKQKEKIDRAAQDRLTQLGQQPVHAPARAQPAHSRASPDISSTMTGLPHVDKGSHGWLSDHLRQGFQEDFSSANAARRVLYAVLHQLPLTMLVLMPLFALLLKLFFPRRLYMEHLLVALHSHAFVFLDLILIVILGQLASWSASVGPLATALGWMSVAAGWWIPIYLLLMQKGVYQQRWPVAAVSYLGIGVLYIIMLSAALAIVLGISVWH
ncbi:MAG: DUF3667 domain-containing protein [Metallibacterium sp.]